MNLIQQHMENVSLELARLEERMVQLKAEQDETRKLLSNIRRYRKSLNKQYPSSQATLPLAPPDDEEEEATDEVDDADAMRESQTFIDSDPDEPEPPYQAPEAATEIPEIARPSRRIRKAKAAAEE